MGVLAGRRSRRIPGSSGPPSTGSPHPQTPEGPVTPLCLVTQWAALRAQLHPCVRTNAYTQELTSTHPSHTHPSQEPTVMLSVQRPPSLIQPACSGRQSSQVPFVHPFTSKSCPNVYILCETIPSRLLHTQQGSLSPAVLSDHTKTSSTRPTN